jgi:pSer/pThr/pTyr-binding forkhead associated (FHA) protein
MAINNTKRILIADSLTDCSNDESMAIQSNETHILIIEDDQGRKEFTLDQSRYSIGRDRDCDIHLVSQFVSRRHATLVKLPKNVDQNDKRYYYRIVDGNGKGKASSNGLMINGRSKITVHDLKNEDEVVFGPQVRAIYYLLQRDATQTGQTDASEYDITLINPSMTEDTED